MNGVTVVDHPLAQDKLAQMRREETPPAVFRRLMAEIGGLIAYEATRDLPLRRIRVRTPVAETEAGVLADDTLVFAPVLRAGLGLLEGMLTLAPNARVAHLGFYRDPATLACVEYYFKAPPNLDRAVTVVVDPMLATGGTAVAAVDHLKAAGARALRLACLVAAPEGLANFHARHPDVPVWTAAIDERLNDHGYIVPGLGDAGDRLYGTR